MLRHPRRHDGVSILQKFSPPGFRSNERYAHHVNCHTIHIEGGRTNVACASFGCSYATYTSSTPEISVLNFDKQVGNRPLTLLTITELLTEVRQNPKSELGAAAGGEIAGEQQGKRRQPARRIPAIFPEWGWCDPGTDIATNLG